jgi:hypothetical protein
MNRSINTTQVVAVLQNYCRLLQHHRTCLNDAPRSHFTIVILGNRGYTVQLISAENYHIFRVLNEGATTLQEVSDQRVSEQILEVLILQHRTKLHHHLFLMRRCIDKYEVKKNHPEQTG